MARRMIAVEWSVKGYNIYRRRPHSEKNMYLMGEPENVYDRNISK